ncbi:hypothetical protein [Agromyces italicus]|uniref:hypothetical protein n=1 Tax=Agromyces italicus TaxID=279572 RepID=UPI0003B6454E|nr:hypothetical protein [Agromyces italicus]
MSIRKALVALAAAAALVLAGAGPAMAGGSPHFIKSATSASADGVNVVVQFKEAGLSSGSVETVQATAHLDATYQCINNGGNNPSDPKKTTVSADVSESGAFTAGKNGNLVGMLSLSPPAAADVLDCPNGQTSTLTAVTWSNVRVDDLTSGASIMLKGTFSSGSPV